MKNFQALQSKAVKGTHTPKSDLRSWQWADQHIDYSRVPNYDTPFVSRFDSARMPFWRDVLDDLRDPGVREIAILKCSRAGYSENVVLTDLRFSICEDPELSFYISAAEDLTKGFLEKRVVRGMGLCPQLAIKYKKAYSKKEDIHFPEMDFRCTWSANKTATKQDGFRKIYVDEIDLFPENTIDAIRRRCSAYALHHIVWGGSLDFERKGDPEEAPIYKLYMESDRRVWKMNDGKGDFIWNLQGIKWDESLKTSDGWDLNAVAETAHYITPSGVKITEEERMDYTRSGRWEQTFEGIRRGYKITAPMIPFFDNSFGEIAKKFLSAKQRHGVTTTTRGKQSDPMRVFFAEYLAEPHYEKKMEATEESLADRVADYQFGTHPAESIEHYKEVPTSIIATLDVQKDCLYIVIRAWFSINGGDSALIYAGQVDDWAGAFALCKQHNAERIYCDAAYSLRQTEVYEVAMRTPGFVPIIDNAKLQGIYRKDTVDPYEGTRRQGTGHLITRYTINPDTFRHKLMELMRGETDQQWFLPRGTPMDYYKQVTAERYVAGSWQKIRRDNHLFDCEVMQVFAGARHRILEFYMSHE
jgi:phage terminase large subunit GpA-like protein